jgi:uncharacterized SAM-binding protein YcdF (DUF218 family)
MVDVGMLVRLRRWRGWRTIGLLARLGLAIAAVVLLLTTLVLHVYGQQDRAAAADVLIVLGAGVEEGYLPSDAALRRCGHAAALYRDGYAPVIISTGGVINSVLSEAEVCARVMVEAGVPRDAILLEEISRSTEENVIFAAELMAAYDQTTALIVTDRYHLLRAQVLSAQHGLTLAGLSPAQETTDPIPLDEYLVSLGREALALYWQGFKTVFNLPFTRVDGI